MKKTFITFYAYYVFVFFISVISFIKINSFIFTTFIGCSMALCFGFGRTYEIYKKDENAQIVKTILRGEE